MGLHQLHFSQKLPVDIHKAWDFLSSPKNLETITPKEMKFEIRTGFKEGDKMYAGMLISYLVTPAPGIPMKWLSEITHVYEPFYFVDEQRSGPYKFWHHQHFLKEINGGVEMQDIISYKIPFGIVGDFLNTLFIRKQLQNIFDFRKKKLEELFGKHPDK